MKRFARPRRLLRTWKESESRLLNSQFYEMKLVAKRYSFFPTVHFLHCRLLFIVEISLLLLTFSWSLVVISLFTFIYSSSLIIQCWWWQFFFLFFSIYQSLLPPSTHFPYRWYDEYLIPNKTPLYFYHTFSSSSLFTVVVVVVVSRYHHRIVCMFEYFVC